MENKNEQIVKEEGLARSLQPAAKSETQKQKHELPKQKHAKADKKFPEDRYTEIRVHSSKPIAHSLQAVNISFKIFDTWDTNSVVINDPGLRNYISFVPRTIPYTFGRFSTKKFGKANMNVVERIANKLMVTGHIKDSRIHKRVSGRDSGKKQSRLKIVKHALMIIEQKTKKNPLQVLVRAIENTSPREETTRIRQGGIIVHKSVDSSPARRVDVATRFITHGAGMRCFNKKASLENALADEIIAAANHDTKCYSVAKKEEIERVAASAR